MPFRTATRCFLLIAFLVKTIDASAQIAPAPGTPAASSALPVPPFSSMAAGAVGPVWRVAGLPGQKVAVTSFDIVSLDAQKVLRLQTNASYGNLVLDIRQPRLGPGALLRWRSRLERGLTASNLATRPGDDSPLKVCALFDLPLAGMSLAEAARLRLARALSGEVLPSATLCYVWDRLLPEGTVLANAYSHRVRYLVVSSGDARPGQWVAHERRLEADFLRVFADETSTLPPLVALVVAADSDNTGGQSPAYVGDLTLSP